MGIMLMASVSANAQINLGNLGKVVSSAIGGSDPNIWCSQVKQCDQRDSAGTWSYQEPAVIFESSNLLKSRQVAKWLHQSLRKNSPHSSKAGITAGKFMVAFTEDGKFTTYKNGQATTSGIYTSAAAKSRSYLEGSANVSGYAQFDNNNLSLTFDSSKLLDVVGKVSKYSGNSTLSTVSSLGPRVLMV